MKAKETSFSFEKVFDKPNCCEDTLVKIDPSYIPCFVKQGVNTKHIIESMFEQAKRQNCAEILMEKSFSEFKFSQEGFFKRFLEMTDFIFKKYADSLVLFKRYNFDNERKERLYAYVLEKIDSKQFYPFDFEYTTYVFPKKIPILNNAFMPVYKLFEKYYTTDKAGKLLDVIVNKNKDFSDLCRGEMLGINNAVSMKDFLPTAMEIFKKDTSIVEVNEEFFKTSINPEAEEQLIQEIYDDFEQVKQDYKKLYNFINKSRDAYLDLDNTTDVYAAERIFMNTIMELCCYHLLAFQAKLDCANEYFKQAYSIINQAYNICQDTDTSKRVHEAAEFAFKRSIVANPTDKYDDIVDKEYESLKFEKLLTDCCIREAMIIAEGVNVEDRLESLHEGAIDSFINFLKKAKDTIALYLNKFTQWFDKYTASTKAYLEKYKDLITKNKLAGFEPVEIQDYDTGMKRLNEQLDLTELQNKVNEIAQAKPVTEAQDNNAGGEAGGGNTGNGNTEGNNGNNNANTNTNGANNEDVTDADELAIYQALIKDYQPKDKNGNDVSFDDFCKNYFLGGEDTITKDPDTFNVQEMYNFCYNTNDLIEILKSDQSKASNFLDVLTNETSKVADTIKADQTGGSKEESTILPYGVHTLVLSELGMGKVTTVSNAAQAAGDNKNVQSSLKNASSDKLNVAKKAIQGLPTQPDHPKSKELEKRVKVFNKMASAVQSYLKGKSIAAETICSDYMKLMKISVTYYISQSNKEQ